MEINASTEPQSELASLRAENAALRERAGELEQIVIQLREVPATSQNYVEYKPLVRIKPCPICESPGKVWGSNMVGCSNPLCGTEVDFGHWCGRMKDGRDAVEAVIERWNKRPIEDALRAKLAAAETLVEALASVSRGVMRIPTMTDAELELLKENCSIAIATIAAGDALNKEPRKP